jgi:hypothetical protein
MFSLDIRKCFATGLCFLLVLKRSHVTKFHDNPPKRELTFSMGMDWHFEDNSLLSQLREHTCKLPTLYRLFFCPHFLYMVRGKANALVWICVLVSDTSVIISQKCVTAREQHMGETLVFGISRQEFLLKHLHLCTVLHGITYQKTAILILKLPWKPQILQPANCPTFFLFSSRMFLHFEDRCM